MAGSGLGSGGTSPPTAAGTDSKSETCDVAGSPGECKLDPGSDEGPCFWECSNGSPLHDFNGSGCPDGGSCQKVTRCDQLPGFLCESTDLSCTNTQFQDCMPAGTPDAPKFADTSLECPAATCFQSANFRELVLNGDGTSIERILWCSCDEGCEDISDEEDVQDVDGNRVTDVCCDNYSDDCDPDDESAEESNLGWRILNNELCDIYDGDEHDKNWCITQSMDADSSDSSLKCQVRLLMDGGLTLTNANEWFQFWPTEGGGMSYTQENFENFPTYQREIDLSRIDWQYDSLDDTEPDAPWVLCLDPNATDPGASSLDTSNFEPGPDKLPVYVIALIAGGIVGVAFLLFFLWWKRRTDKRMKEEIEEIKNMPTSVPGQLGTTSGKGMSGLSASRTATEGDLEAAASIESVLNLDVKWDSINKDRVLGKGAYGVVWLVDVDGTSLVLKELKTASTSDAIRKVQERSLLKEFEILLKLPTHVNVVAYYGITRDHHLGILMPFYDRGSLSELLYGSQKGSSDNFRFDIVEKLFITVDIAAGLAHLHENGVVHRDIAARNILIHTKQGIREEYRAVISDFGLSQVLLDHVENKVAGKRRITGPLKWMAKESLIEGTYNTMTDMFAFAMTCFEILEEKEPWSLLTPNKAANKTVKGLRPEFQSAMAEGDDPESNLWDILISTAKDCWRDDPLDRPTAKQVVDHLQQVKETLLEEGEDLGYAAWEEDENPEGVYAAFVPEDEYAEAAETERAAVLAKRLDTFKDKRGTLGPAYSGPLGGRDFLEEADDAHAKETDIYISSGGEQPMTGRTATSVKSQKDLQLAHQDSQYQTQLKHQLRNKLRNSRKKKRRTSSYMKLEYQRQKSHIGLNLDSRKRSRSTTPNPEITVMTPTGPTAESSDLPVATPMRGGKPDLSEILETVEKEPPGSHI